jgi:tetratricopeptide (TPR) repeat protein
MSRWISLVAASALLGGALALVECSRAGDTGAADCVPMGEAVVDRALVAFLSKARAAHHEADLALDDGDTDLAIAALDGLARGPRPGHGESPPEVAEVLADTHARLADLESDLGDFTKALGEVESGLSLAPAPTHFRGHLFEVKGVVLERQSKALDALGETAGAERAKASAVEAFEAAIKIQDQVIREALPGAGP